MKNIELGGALRKSSSQTSGYAGVRGGISALIGFGKVSPPCDIPIWLMSSEPLLKIRKSQAAFS